MSHASLAGLVAAGGVRLVAGGGPEDRRAALDHNLAALPHHSGAHGRAVEPGAAVMKVKRQTDKLMVLYHLELC